MRFWSPLLPCIATIWRFALGKVVEWHVFFERIEKELSSWGEAWHVVVQLAHGVYGGRSRWYAFFWCVFGRARVLPKTLHSTRPIRCRPGRRIDRFLV